MCYKIITQITSCHKQDIACNENESSPLCTRCNIGIETVEHKFWLCHVVHPFWKDVVVYINNFKIRNYRITFALRDVILGVADDPVFNRICIGKSIITRI